MNHLNVSYLRNDNVTSRELADIIELFSNQVANDTISPQLVTYIPDCLDDETGMVIAFKRNKIVGASLLQFVQFDDCNDFGTSYGELITANHSGSEICIIEQLEAYKQNIGVGTAILSCLKDHCSSIILEPSKSAIGFYSKNGFRETDTVSFNTSFLYWRKENEYLRSFHH